MGSIPEVKRSIPKVNRVWGKVWLCAQGRRCLAKAWVVYWRCAETKTKGAWSGIASGGVKTTRVLSSEVGQKVRTW